MKKNLLLIIIFEAIFFVMFFMIIFFLKRFNLENEFSSDLLTTFWFIAILNVSSAYLNLKFKPPTNP